MGVEFDAQAFEFDSGLAGVVVVHVRRLTLTHD